MCIRSLNGTTLLDASERVKETWRPVIDGRLLRGDPVVMVRSGTYHKSVKVVMGENSDEGYLCFLSLVYGYSPYTMTLVENKLTYDDFSYLIQNQVYSGNCATISRVRLYKFTALLLQIRV